VTEVVPVESCFAAQKAQPGEELVMTMALTDSSSQSPTPSGDQRAPGHCSGRDRLLRAHGPPETDFSEPMTT
jgi:hypothetical protein